MVEFAIPVGCACVQFSSELNLTREGEGDQSWASTNRERDVLFSINHIGHWGSDGAAREIDRPQFGAVCLVVRDQPRAIGRAPGAEAIEQERLRQEWPVVRVVSAERWQIEVP